MALKIVELRAQLEEEKRERTRAEERVHEGEKVSVGENEERD